MSIQAWNSLIESISWPQCDILCAVLGQLVYKPIGRQQCGRHFGQVSDKNQFVVTIGHLVDTMGQLVDSHTFSRKIPYLYKLKIFVFPDNITTDLQVYLIKSK